MSKFSNMGRCRGSRVCNKALQKFSLSRKGKSDSGGREGGGLEILP